MGKIGLSVSGCIADILRDIVRERDVLAIVAGTCVRDGDWSYVIENYTRYDWDGNPEGEAILRRLLDSGRIVQPRVNGQKPAATYNGRWLDVEYSW